jgi:proline iminopeptidase
VQGRHDVLCPPYTARALHAAWPGSALRIVEAGAHALFEKPMRTAVQVIAIECR